MEIVFEALPDYTYPGEIVSVDPVLVDGGRHAGRPVLRQRGPEHAHPVNPLSGMNAEVEVVAGEARNAVLVPLQALREVGVELADQGQAGPVRRLCGAAPTASWRCASSRWG